MEEQRRNEKKWWKNGRVGVMEDGQIRQKSTMEERKDGGLKNGRIDESKN